MTLTPDIPSFLDMRKAKKNESSGSGFVWDARESSRLGDTGFTVRSDEAEWGTSDYEVNSDGFCVRGERVYVEIHDKNQYGLTHHQEGDDVSEIHPAGKVEWFPLFETMFARAIELKTIGQHNELKKRKSAPSKEV